MIEMFTDAKISDLAIQYPQVETTVILNLLLLYLGTGSTW